MHSTKSQFIEKSTAFPGVEFTIRTLNTIARAERDASIMDQRLEYSRLTSERATQFKALVGDEGSIEDRNARANALPLDKRLAIIELDERADAIYQRHIVPATIRAAFVSISGYELDGDSAPGVDALIAGAPDELLAEIHAACVRGSSLTGEEAKN